MGFLSFQNLSRLRSAARARPQPLHVLRRLPCVVVICELISRLSRHLPASCPALSTYGSSPQLQSNQLPPAGGPTPVDPSVEECVRKARRSHCKIHRGHRRSDHAEYVGWLFIVRGRIQPPRRCRTRELRFDANLCLLSDVEARSPRGYLTSATCHLEAMIPENQSYASTCLEYSQARTGRVLLPNTVHIERLLRHEAVLRTFHRTEREKRHPYPNGSASHSPRYRELSEPDCFQYKIKDRPTGSFSFRNPCPWMLRNGKNLRIRHFPHPS